MEGFAGFYFVNLLQVKSGIMKLKLLAISIAVLLAFCGECRAAVELLQGRDTTCAVVLYSGAKYAMEAKLNTFGVRREYHKRIQILTEEGMKYARVSIPYHRFVEYTETVGGIKATVSRGDGSNVREMGREHIRDVHIDGNYRRKEFTVPGVIPGDIIELRYEVVGMFPQYYEKQMDSTSNVDDFGFITRTGTGDDIIFPKWDFQDEIPVDRSELEFVYFDEYRFEATVNGEERVQREVQDGGVYKKMNRQVVARKHFSLSTGVDKESNKKGIKKTNVNSHMGSFKGAYTEKYLRKMKFTAVDLPAIVKGEEYVINPQKYKASVQFDFKGKYAKYKSAKETGSPMGEQSETGGDFNYANSWTDVSKILFDSRFFGSKIFYMQDFYMDYADSVKRLHISDYEKVQLICTHIRNDIECTWKDGGMFIYSPRNTFNKKEGSNVDICAIAYKTLDKAGFKPKLVMLRSRDAGHLHTSGISVGALNNAVLHITLKDGRTVLFDPTGNPKDTRLLNPMFLVKEGIVYNRGEERINLMNAVENKEYHNAALFVGADGMVNGHCRSIFTNHSAYEKEGAAPQINAEEGEVKYGTLDSLQSRYTREFTFRRTSAVMVDDRIFINPFAEIYFSAEDFSGPRTYPVEFRNPKTIEYTATIRIPDGYEVYELPQKVAIYQPLCGASATLLSKVQGNIVQFGLTVKLDNATIQLDQYGDFQQWWQQMCALFDEMIVLRKKGGKSFTETEKMTA